MFASPSMGRGVCINQALIQQMILYIYLYYAERQICVTFQSVPLKRRDDFGRRRHVWECNAKLNPKENV
jgi:hypothetical protein